MEFLNINGAPVEAIQFTGNNAGEIQGLLPAGCRQHSIFAGTVLENGGIGTVLTIHPDPKNPGTGQRLEKGFWVTKDSFGKIRIFTDEIFQFTFKDNSPPASTT